MVDGVGLKENKGSSGRYRQIGRQEVRKDRLSILIIYRSYYSTIIKRREVIHSIIKRPSSEYILLKPIG